jgi:hypothetical protein
MTLQVPERQPEEGEEIVEVDEQHFQRLTYELPSSNGFLHFSHLGYEYYKETLREAFVDTGKGTWGDFEKAAGAHFLKVETRLKGEIEKLDVKRAHLIAELAKTRDSSGRKF